MNREELLSRARRELWAGWVLSSEEIGSQAAETLLSVGMLVEPGGAAELDRLRGLLNAQPADLTEAQVEALAAAGDRVVNDAMHEDLCACDAWPERCVSTGNYFKGAWDVSGLETALPAVLGLWESMRADAAAEELGRLRARVAELEALKPASIQTCRKCGAGYTYGEPCSTCLFQARMAAETQALREDESGEERLLDGDDLRRTLRGHLFGGGSQ